MAGDELTRKALRADRDDPYWTQGLLPKLRMPAAPALAAIRAEAYRGADELLTGDVFVDGSEIKPLGSAQVRDYNRAGWGFASFGPGSSVLKVGFSGTVEGF